MVSSSTALLDRRVVTSQTLLQWVNSARRIRAGMTIKSYPIRYQGNLEVEDECLVFRGNRIAVIHSRQQAETIAQILRDVVDELTMLKLQHGIRTSSARHPGTEMQPYKDPGLLAAVVSEIIYLRAYPLVPHCYAKVIAEWLVMHDIA